MILTSLSVGIVVTVLIRLMGGLTSRLATSDRVQEYLTCVTYALLGALTARLILLPNNELAETQLAFRLIAALVAIAVVLVLKWPLWRGLIVGLLMFGLLGNL